MDWMLMPLRRYAEFSGRSRRKEYWMYVLLLIIAGLVIGIIEGAVGLNAMFGPYGPLSLLLAVATFVPSLAVSIRRLHDTNRSGWWMLIALVPYILLAAVYASGSLMLAGILSLVALAGAIVLLVFMVLEGNKGPNQYGPDPKGTESEAVTA